MDSFTPNYNFTLPEVGFSVDSWGQKLNADFLTIDTELKKAQVDALAGKTLAGTMVPLAGGTMIGNLTAPSFAVDNQFLLTMGGGSRYPTIILDAGDGFQFDRTLNSLVFNLSSSPAFSIAPGGISANFPVSINAIASQPQHATRKDYVDAAVQGAINAGAGKLSLTGGTLSGQLTVANAGIGIQNDGCYLTMYDTNWGTRSLHHNDGSMGFTNNSGGWAFRNDNSGNVWTAAYGWLHEYFLGKNGSQTFNGNLTIGGNAGIYANYHRFASDGGSGIDTGGGGVVSLVANNLVQGTFNSNGDLVMRTNVYANSDRRIKTNIQTLTGALGKIEQMRGVSYDRTDVPGLRQIGFIAQEVMEVIPEVVGKPPGQEMYAVSYGNIVAMQNEAIKELAAMVRGLTARVDAMEGGTNG